MNRDGFSGLPEEGAVVTDAETEETIELTRQWFDPARASVRIAVDSLKNGHRDGLRNRAELRRNFRLETDFFTGRYVFVSSPRI